MDLRLKNDAVFQIVGPSGSGKTLFVTNLLKNGGNKYFVKRIKKIYWLTGSGGGGQHDGDGGEKGMTARQRDKLKNVIFIDGFEDGWMDMPQNGDAIVIDDLFIEAAKEKNFNNLFTKIARHRGVTVIFITQNMFQQGGQHRTRNLNVHYLIIFKNPRDRTVIDYVSRQAFPHNKNFLPDAFDDATKNKPYGYLFIDFTQSCPDELRVRTNIFDDGANGIIVYKQE
jgi:hypothetical protein